MEKAPVTASSEYFGFLLKKCPSHKSEFARRDYFSPKDMKYKGNSPPFTSSGAEFLLSSSATAALLDYELLMRPFIWGPHQQAH